MSDKIEEFNPSACVKEFIDKFEASKDPDLWVKLIKEEAKEVREAAANLLKEMADLAYVASGLVNVVGEDKAREIAESLEKDEDISTAVQFLGRVDLDDDMVEEAFKRVHASNMSKLGDDGKPNRREDGKVLKGPNYKPPYLLDLVK